MVKKRLPAVPTIALILKIAAILFLVFSTIILIREIGDAMKTGIKWSPDIVLNVISKWFEQSLFPSAFAWVAAELMLGVRDIEYNGRRMLLATGQPAGAVTLETPTATAVPDSDVTEPHAPAAPSEPGEEERPAA